MRDVAEEEWCNHQGKGERRTYCRYLWTGQGKTGQDRTDSSSAFCIFVLAYALLALPALCWSSKIRLLPSMGIIVSVHVKKKTWRPFHAACRQSPSFCTQRWSDLLTVSVFFGFLLLLACNVRPRLCFSLKHSPSSWRKTCLYLLYYLVSGLRRALLAFRGVDTTAWRVCVVAQQRYVLCEVHAIDRNGTLTSKILQMQR